MLSGIKNSLYFTVASYFRIFAEIKLSIWRPKVIVVTGSYGKTTTMSLLEAQLGNKAYYSHHANSAFGIPFNILCLERKTFSIFEWVSLFIKAPVKAFSNIQKEAIYVVEADCDRPGEGKFLAELLNPDITIWVSCSTTHSANFDKYSIINNFQTVDDAIAYEFGYFLEKTREASIINADFPLILEQIERTKKTVIRFSEKDLKSYKVSTDGTEYKIDGNDFELKYILPKAVFFSLAAITKTLEYLGFDLDPQFRNFQNPSGRSSIFKGKKGVTIIDSSYNASTNAVVDSINLVADLSKNEKRPVALLLGDMRELGKEAEKEHEKVAELINEKVNVLYCVGPLTQKFVIPNVKSSIQTHWFKNSKDAGKYIEENIPKESILLVKGSQNEIFLEEAIKEILLNSDDKEKLCRQDSYWMKIKKSFFEK